MTSNPELESRIAQLEAKLRELEAERSERPLRSMIESLLPSDARSHMRAAQKEQLLAMRCFLDQWIEKVDESKAKTPRRSESISVE